MRRLRRWVAAPIIAAIFLFDLFFGDALEERAALRRARERRRGSVSGS